MNSCPMESKENAPARMALKKGAVSRSLSKISIKQRLSLLVEYPVLFVTDKAELRNAGSLNDIQHLG